MGEIARRSMGNTKKKYNFYNTTNTLFTSKKSTSSSNASDAQLAIFLSKSHITSTTYFLVAQTESKTFNPKLFTFYGRRYLKNWNQKCVYQRTNLSKKSRSFHFWINLLTDVKSGRTRTWIGKHERVSVSTSINLIDNLIFSVTKIHKLPVVTWYNIWSF